MERKIRSVDSNLDSSLRDSFRFILLNPFPLSEEQIRALLSGDSQGRAILIKAGPGSGKTSLLVRRILYLILRGIDPSDILLTTFTNRASRELKSRLHSSWESMNNQVSINLWSRIDSDPSKGLRIGSINTIHGLCIKLLDSTEEVFKTSEGDVKIEWSLISEHRRHSLIESVVEDTDFARSDNAREYVTGLSYLQSRYLNPRHARSNVDSEREVVLSRVWNHYHQRKRDLKLYDFQDVITECVRQAQQDDSTREDWQSKFERVIVDEFQDTGYLQLLLLKTLSKPANHFFAVGDSQQSIYSWRGACPENIDEFGRYFPDYEELTLTRNFRSKANIVMTANDFLSGERKDIIPSRYHREGGLKYGENIAVFEGIDRQEELSFLSYQIKNIVENSEWSYSDIAVLTRINDQLVTVKNHFDRAGVPYTEVGDEQFFQSPVTKTVIDTITVLRKIAHRNTCDSWDPGDSSMEFFSDWWNAELTPFKTLNNQDTKNQESLIQDISRYLNGEIKHSKLDLKLEVSSRKVLESLKKLHNELSSGAYLPDQLECVETILDLGYERKRRNQLRTIMDWLTRHTMRNGYKGVKQVLRLFRMQKFDPQYTVGNNGDSVQAMTFHASKGLEFPIVFLAGLQEQFVPMSDKREEDVRPFKQAKEEERLFYVALTRACEELYLTYHLRKKQDNYIKRCNSSPFIDRLPREFVDYRPAPGGFLERLGFELRKFFYGFQ